MRTAEMRYLEAYDEIKPRAERLPRLLETHWSAARNKAHGINYSHVGDLLHVADMLAEIERFLGAGA